MGSAGTAGGILATLLWAYRYYANHIFSWDLLAVAVTIAGIKQKNVKQSLSATEITQLLGVTRSVAEPEKMSFPPPVVGCVR